jgi:hypothetical protein
MDRISSPFARIDPGIDGIDSGHFKLGMSMRAIICTIALCLLVGCGAEAKDAYTRVRSDRSPLIDGFSSYAPRAEVEGQLKRAGLPYSIGEENCLAPTDRRPTYEVAEIKVQKFTHLGHTGDLRLSFFNNRLSHTWFYPADPEAYLLTLRSAGLQVSEQRTLKGNTVMWTYQAFDGRRCVGWADTRLDEEHSNWIWRYS